MLGLFPKAPFIPVAGQGTVPVCEWVMPAPAVRRRDNFSTYKMLPSGMPDCLYVSIDYFEDGIGRCTAAIYGGRAFVIHYELKPRVGV